MGFGCGREGKRMIWVYRLGFLALLVALWILASQQFRHNVVPSPLATFEAAQRLIAGARSPRTPSIQVSAAA